MPSWSLYCLHWTTRDELKCQAFVGYGGSWQSRRVKRRDNRRQWIGGCTLPYWAGLKGCSCPIVITFVWANEWSSWWSQVFGGSSSRPPGNTEVWSPLLLKNRACGSLVKFSDRLDDRHAQLSLPQSKNNWRCYWMWLALQQGEKFGIIESIGWWFGGPFFHMAQSSMPWVAPYYLEWSCLSAWEDCYIWGWWIWI